MPAGQPFTRLCETIGGHRLGRADLHVHTTASDGSYSPEQVVEIARRCGLAAVAITDHDCVDGIQPARHAAVSVEVISGVEVTTHWNGQELHLLGYFFDEDNPSVRHHMKVMQQLRSARFLEMAERLRKFGITLDEELIASASGPSLGRRNLAELLQKAGHVQSIREAFQRYLSDRGPIPVPKERLDIELGINVIANAGGVTSLAHPPENLSGKDWQSFAGFGLNAIEVRYPNCKPAHSRKLKEQAARWNLAVTGGSDCHGPEPVRRGIGSATVSPEELNQLRKQCWRE